MTTEAIYKKFDRATRSIEAWLICKDGVNLGRVVLKHGDQVTSFVQAWGCDMQSGWARGGGYDRSSAAVQAAALGYLSDEYKGLRENPSKAADLVNALASLKDDGRHWDDQLRDLGYDVWGVC